LTARYLILFVHLYGRYDFLGIIEREEPKNKSANIDENSNKGFGVKFSLNMPEYSSDRRPDMKSVAGYKVWVPNKMKWHLNKLAEHNKMSLSHYAREVIMTHILGNISIDQDIFNEEPPDEE